MSHIVYICFASTGEYSDRTEIMLHGYRTEKEAQDFVLCSQEHFNKRWVNVKDDYHNLEINFPKGWHPECPELDQPAYTGYRFWYEAVEIKPRSRRGAEDIPHEVVEAALNAYTGNNCNCNSCRKDVIRTIAAARNAWPGSEISWIAGESEDGDLILPLPQENP